MATGSGGPGQSCLCGHDPAIIRSGCGPRGALLRTGKLVPRRRRPDAVHRMALWRAEPGAPYVPPKHIAGGFDPCVEVVRPGATVAPGRLVKGAPTPSSYGHH